MYVHLHLLHYNLNLFSPVRLPSLPHEMCLVRVSPWSPSGHSVVLLRAHLPVPLPPSSFWACLLWKYFLHLASRTRTASSFLSVSGRFLLFPNRYMLASPATVLSHISFSRSFPVIEGLNFLPSGPLYVLKIIEEIRELLFMWVIAINIYIYWKLKLRNLKDHLISNHFKW